MTDTITPEEVAEKLRRARTARLILTQAAEIERLKEALKPFAGCCQHIGDDEPDTEWAKFRLEVRDYRAARAALEQEGG